MLKSIVTRRLAKAGIAINGKALGDIIVTNNRFYTRAAFFGSLGIADSYRDRDFLCKDLDAFFEKWMGHLEQRDQLMIQRRSRIRKRKISSSLPEAWLRLQLLFSNQQSAARAVHAISHHYDTGNELYAPMLGKTMAYS